MRFAILGSGAVGGYFGATLARAGNEVTFIARGSNLRAIRERGLLIWSQLGDFAVPAAAEADTAKVGPVDVVILAVKTYDNEAALPALRPLLGNDTLVLTLQNGVDSADQVAEVVGERAVLGGSAYIAAALVLPGVVEQTGTHRRIILGDVFGDRTGVSPRVEGLRAVLSSAGIEAEAVPDARVPIWRKLIFIAPFAGFTGAARLPIGPLWRQPGFPDLFHAAAAEVERVARAEGIEIGERPADAATRHVESVPPATRASLLVDLLQGKRIEVEALLGSVVRRGRAAGVRTPIMATLYALLKPYEHGQAIQPW
jgi:2-dehydropantoate 2-reductase